MKPWIGWWLVVLSLVHIVYAAIVFGPVLRTMFERGVVNTGESDPMAGLATWFVFCGHAWLMLGLALLALGAKPAAASPRIIGWVLVFGAVVGVVLIPNSGMWLLFPPAIGVLINAHRPAGGIHG